MESPSSNTSPTEGSVDVAFFAVSFKRLYVLSVITGGLYDVYWFYKNWKAIKLASGRKIMPFWRAVFSLIWVWSLFQEVKDVAVESKYDKKIQAGWLATAYIVIAMCTLSLARQDGYSVTMGIWAIALGLFGPLPLLPIVRAISYSNRQLSTTSVIDLPHKTSRGEAIVIVIGFVLFVLTMIAYFVPNSFMSSNSMSTEARTAKSKVNSLTAKYDTCLADLDARGDSVNTASLTEVDKYNDDVKACEQVRLDQNAAVDAYNALVD